MAARDTVKINIKWQEGREEEEEGAKLIIITQPGREKREGEAHANILRIGWREHVPSFPSLVAKLERNKRVR